MMYDWGAPETKGRVIEINANALTTFVCLGWLDKCNVTNTGVNVIYFHWKKKYHNNGVATILFFNRTVDQ